jgi:hypothetical protein
MDLIPEYLGPKRSGTKITVPVPSEFSVWLQDSVVSFEAKRKIRSLKKLLSIK